MRVDHVQHVAGDFIHDGRPVAKEGGAELRQLLLAEAGHHAADLAGMAPRVGIERWSARHLLQKKITKTTSRVLH